MSEDGTGFTVTVTMRSSTLSSLIDGACILGALIAERLAPGPPRCRWPPRSSRSTSCGR